MKTCDEDTDWCDIIGHDPYWVPGRVGRLGISYAATLTERVRAVADEERKPAWMVLVGERIAATYRRYVNAREQRCQTYLALIAGARGIFYYHWPIRFQSTWETLCELAQEVQALSPALLNTDVPQSVTYHVGEKQYRLGDVPTALFSYPDGRRVLLSANHRNYPVDVTCRIAGLEDGATLTELFGDRELVAAGGAFSEHFEPFATRAWAIDGDLATPAQITVDMEPKPELAEEEPDALPYATGRPDMRNILPNPSFEDATNPGWPDYYDPPWFARTTEDRIGLPGCPYQLDADNPWHGAQSLRIEARKRNRLKLWLRNSEPLVLSAWMRADSDGVRVWVWCGGKVEGQFRPVTTQWQRYSVRLPEGTGGWIAIDPQAGSTVWFDAMQLEEGSEPTEFEP